MAMVTTLFFMWGFLTSLNDILVLAPEGNFRFNLRRSDAGAIQLFLLAYFVFALPSGKVVEWIGYKKAMVGGLFTMGLGALFLLFRRRASPRFRFFLAALIVLAAGITVLQVSAETLMSRCWGPERNSLQPFKFDSALQFPWATTVGPWFGSFLILGGAPAALDSIRGMLPDQLQAYRLQQASSVKLPYLGVAVALFVAGPDYLEIQAASHLRRRKAR